MSRRFLIAGPTFHDWDLGTYVSKILARRRLACETFAYTPLPSRREANRQLLEAVGQYRPDVLLGLKLDQIDAETIAAIRSRGVLCFLWYVDCNAPEVPRWIRPLLKEVDAAAITAKGLIPEFSRFTRRPVAWIYEGVHLPSFPLHLPAPSLALYGSDVAFVGNIYYPSTSEEGTLRRHRLLKRIQQRFELKVWGAQGDPQARRKWGSSYPVIEWPAYNRELVHICQASKIVLGINRTVDNLELYFSNRTYLTLACRGFLLTPYVPGLETMFQNEEHLVWYHSEEECLELIEFYRNRPRLRQRIAAAGCDWVRRRYSMARQVGRILNIVDECHER